MRSRVAIGAAALGVLVVAWTMTRGGAGTKAAAWPARPKAATPAPAIGRSPAEAPPDEVRRNIFRFADERRADEAGLGNGEALRREAGPLPPPESESLPRLVGLLSRGGRVVAALVAGDGEVELAGPGETAAGVVVVAIGDDSVRVRRPDGTETAIPVP